MKQPQQSGKPEHCFFFFIIPISALHLVNGYHWLLPRALAFDNAMIQCNDPMHCAIWIPVRFCQRKVCLGECAFLVMAGPSPGVRMEGRVFRHETEHVQSSISKCIRRVLPQEKPDQRVFRLLQVEGLLLQGHCRCPSDEKPQHLRTCGGLVECLCGLFGS